VGGGNSLKNNNLDKITHYDEFIFSEVETIPEIPNNLASLVLSSAKDAGNLATGTKYTILAYKKKAGDSYVFHKKQDFTIGNTDSKIELDAGENYTLIIVSIGTNTTPNITNLNSFSEVSLIPGKHEDNNRKFLYQKKENFIPKDGINDPIDIKLKGSTSISVIVDTRKMLAGDTGAEINQLTDISIKYRKPKSIKLGNISDTYDYEEVLLPIKNQSFINNNKMLYKIEFHDAFIIKERTDIRFFIKTIQTNEYPANGKIEGLKLNVTPGYLHTSVINPVICGGYLGPNKTNFREFTCHNLGGDYSGIWKDKFMGNMYAWGKKQVVYDNRNNPYDNGNIWKESENPCPSGFRVPTIQEWQNLLNENNNPIEKMYDSNGESIGWKIGTRLALFISSLNDFYKNWIWSSTSINNEYAYTIRVDKEQIYKRVNDEKGLGSAVRCIRKLPEEQ